MGSRFAGIAFTEDVKALQRQEGSRAAYARQERAPGDRGAALGPEERAFLAARDSFYLATVGETGWPYLQHRGGPAGFVRVLDERTLGFADQPGNRQFISLGNLRGNDRVAMIFMDYPNRARLKLLGRARQVGPGDPQTLARLAPPEADGDAAGRPGRPPGRGLLVQVEAFDWNCPQYITERFTAAEVEQAVAPLRRRVEELELELERLQAAAGSGRRG